MGYFLAFLLLVAPQTSANSNCLLNNKYRDLFKNNLSFMPLPHKPHFIGNEIYTEIGYLTDSVHPRVQEILKELHKDSGELRFAVNFDNPEFRYPLFYYDDTKRIPCIVVNPSINLHHLEHELQHFRDFIEMKKFYMQQGMSGDKLHETLKKLKFDPEFRRLTERRAKAREMQIRARENRELGIETNARGVNYPSAAVPDDSLEDFISASTYPESESLKLLALNHPENIQRTSVFTTQQAKVLMNEAIRKALLLKRAAYFRAQDKLAKLAKGQLKEKKELTQYIERHLSLKNLFREIFPAGRRAQFDKHSVEGLHILFNEQLSEMVKKVSELGPRRYQPVH